MTEVDFVARLADAWDGRGPHVLTGPKDHEALMRMADVSAAWSRPGAPPPSWAMLLPSERERLLFAARSLVDLGRTCAWCFGR